MNFRKRTWRINSTWKTFLAQCEVEPNMKVSLLNSVLIFILAVATVVPIEIDASDGVCVSLESNEDFECIHCDSVMCIMKNANDSTHIQFVSKTFLLEETLHISNREDIRLEGTAQPETRIKCKEQSQERIGLEFMNIQNLVIINITVEGCGVWSPRPFLPRFYSAIFLVHCTHVYISGVRVLQSVGSGLAIIDTNGIVTVEESAFENNGIGDTAGVVGAGGLNLQFSSCSSNTWDSECDDSQKWNLNTTYTFVDCNFTNNNASIPESEDAVTVMNDYEKKLLGRGGGLGVVMSEGAANNHITLTRCRFLNNTATWGGGMHVQFRGSSQNLMVVQDCNFENNQCPKKAGGAINIFYDNVSPGGNQVTFEDTTFVNNSAGFGGGVEIYSNPNIDMSIPKNIFSFMNCSWMLNKAYFGSALDVFSYIHPYGFQSKVILSNCVFRNNTIVHGIHEANKSQQYNEGSGALVSTAHFIQFEGKTIFSGNNGTALYMVTSIAIFAPDSTAVFEDNFGFDGGAIALICLAAIHVQQNSHFTFRNNRALSSGGALFYHSNEQHEVFTGSSNCFVKSLASDHKNISFIFDGNQAKFGLDIRATTINHCKSMCNTESNDPADIFKCIGQFEFTNETSVSTYGRWYSVDGSKLPLMVIPGKEFQIPVEVRDDLDQVTNRYFSVRVKNHNNSNIVVDPAYTFITYDQMKLYGQPGHKANLTLTKVGARPITLVFEVYLQKCPPGFDIHSNKNHLMCICSVNTDRNYEGIILCNTTHYFAYAKRGHWVGYENEQIHTSHCPDGYCFHRQKNRGRGGHLFRSLPGNASPEELDKKVCGPTRTGVVCGKCASNHSVYYHTYEFSCGSDYMCRVGWALYITSELLPLTILFLVVIFFDISFTSGAASGFIFFAQVTDSLSINSQGSIWLKPAVYKLTLVYQFIYRLFNFDFFSHKKLAFCLIKGATALDVLAFKYVTVLYAFIMIFVMVLVLNYCSIYFYRKYSCLMKHTFRNSVIHGLSAFLIMCYTQCIRVSFFLLIPTTIYSRGGVKVRNVVFRNGEIDYFSKAHLPYALPAIACLTFALIPPALLILYPLHYRVIAALRLDEKQWFSKISKYVSLERMKPLLDSFQSCFKDNCRFFAGLYFLYRFLIWLFFTVLPSYTMFYAVVEVQLIIILAVHAHVRPYQRQLYNIIDTLVITNLAIINAITLLNYAIISRTGGYSREVNSFTSIQLILVFLPLCTLVGYAVYKAIRKVKAMMKRKDHKTEEEEEEEEEEDVEELEMPARLIYEDETYDSDGLTDYHNYEDTETNMSD